MAWLVWLACALIQERPPMDQSKIDGAIRKGVEYLKKESPKWNAWTQENRKMTVDELVLWTFIHAGVSESDPLFRDLLERMLKTELQVTYRVALQTLILEELDCVGYQWRIAHGAQFLVDNQSVDGQWGYGEPTPHLKGLPTSSSRKPDVSTSGKEKTKIQQYVRIVPLRQMPAGGDNSNSQYALLGLRACHDAGIVFPQDVILKAKKRWESAQNRDGGWCYHGRGDRPSWGSMTVGGIGSLGICRYLLGERNVARDPCIRKGLQWLIDRFTVEENPGKMLHADTPMWNYYYYMYGLERACLLSGLEKLGAYWWYEKGAEVLLKRQNLDGSWVSTEKTVGDHHIYDTCFAILFLRRATRPLEEVATGSSKPPR